MTRHPNIRATIRAGIAAVSIAAGSYIAVHRGLDSVARTGLLESRLFQPDLQRSERIHSLILAGMAGGSFR